jgi:predicted porin
MHTFQLRKSILAAMGACAAIGISPAIALADNAQDIQQLKDQVRQLQQKIDQVSGPKSPAAPASAPATAKGDSGSLTWNGITLYGTVDIGVEYVSHGAPLSQTWSPGLPSVIQNYSNHSILSVNGNGLSQTKLGISGVEPIPGLAGWNGVFRIETGFNPESGKLVDGPGSLANNNGRANTAKISAGDSSRAGQLLNGVAYAGVSNLTFGTLTFGRQNGLNLDLLTKYDPQLQSQAFSPISLSGTAGGFGTTQTNRLDGALKYNLQIGPGHVNYLHDFGSSGFVPQSSNEFGVGVDLGGFSIDALYGLIHGAVAASSLSAANVATLNATPQPLPGWSLANTLAANISDDTGYTVQASYNAKDYFPVKFYAGWERIKFNNPSHPDAVGTLDIGGYILGIVNDRAFNIQRILQISWAGARWAVTPQFELTGAGYLNNQKSNSANGCTNASSGTCAGEQLDISVVADYHLTKRFDTYAGVNWSRVTNGLSNGFLFTSSYAPMVGVRYNF